MNDLDLLPAMSVAPRPAPIPKPSRRQVHGVAWLVLIVWSLIHLGMVLYWASRDWGFLGALPLLFGYAGSAVALTTWLAGWGILGSACGLVRCLYVLLGLIGLAAITGPMIPWWHDWDLVLAWGAVTAGVAVCLAVLRNRGWRIQVVRGPSQGELKAESEWGGASKDVSRGHWQFSLFDLLTITTGVAIVLGLMLIGGRPERGEVAVIAAQIVCTVAILVASLACRSYLRAALLSALVTLSTSAIAIISVNVEMLWEPSNWMLILLFAGPGDAGLLIAALILRSSGYRLAR